MLVDAGIESAAIVGAVTTKFVSVKTLVGLFTDAVGIPVLILGIVKFRSHAASTVILTLSTLIRDVSIVSQLLSIAFSVLNTGASNIFVSSRLLCSVSKCVDILVILYSLLFRINLSARFRL